jgi:hypothetical protein
MYFVGCVYPHTIFASWRFLYEAGVRVHTPYKNIDALVMATRTAFASFIWPLSFYWNLSTALIEGRLWRFRIAGFDGDGYVGARVDLHFA